MAPSQCGFENIDLFIRGGVPGDVFHGLTAATHEQSTLDRRFVRIGYTPQRLQFTGL